MTDRERYKRTFSKLHASEEILLEVNNMKKIGIMPIRRLVAVAAAAMLIAAMATVAYANDVGGIRRHFQIWLNGMPVEVEFSMPDEDTGNYVISYRDDDGTDQMILGHIVNGEAERIDGEADEKPMLSVGAVEVEYRDDGTVWARYDDRDIEITDLLQTEDEEKSQSLIVEYSDGEVKVEDGTVERSASITVQYGDGEGYASASEFVSRIEGDYGSAWVVTDDETAADGNEVGNP